MSITSTRPPLWPWFTRLISGQPHQIIGEPTPFLRRWYLLPKTKWFKVYLHQFVRSDDDRALHDHPWSFTSLVLRGGYDEITENKLIRRRPGSFAFRPATVCHRVVLRPRPCPSCKGTGIGWGRIPSGWLETDCGHCDGSGRVGENPSWTLIITGPKVREWGFWCPPRVAGAAKRFVHWRQWGRAGCGEYT
ncbi:hypothetical protein [Mycolicibacterium sphagni]|uniref:hypothetical protein n=1 Tax=Mycolicibacterium sphagni TaxID=1786 RepID=UPI0021F30723|nr:hypothetical protein [Mycolicibacterium sphagni]MCV7175095.1 hypothetical protein [Mycolicibacterium sphagni]